MPYDAILHFHDYHDEIKPALTMPRQVRQYIDFLDFQHVAHLEEELPPLPDMFPDIKAVATVNGGRWMWQCTGCRAGNVLDSEYGYAICCQCAYHGWLEVEWPANKSEIEEELLRQPGHRLNAPIREWRPGWTLEYLQQRTAKALELVEAGVVNPRSVSV